MNLFASGSQVETVRILAGMVALIEDPGEQNGDPTHQEDSLEAPHPEQNTVLPRAPLLGSPSYLSRILDLFLYNLCLAAPEQIIIPFPSQ